MFCFTVNCPPGYRYDKKNSTCRPCEPNTYQRREGQSKCNRCPGKTSTWRMDGAKSKTDCRGKDLKKMMFENDLYNFSSFVCSRPTTFLQTFMVVFYFFFVWRVFKIKSFGCLVLQFVWHVSTLVIGGRYFESLCDICLQLKTEKTRANQIIFS